MSKIVRFFVVVLLFSGGVIVSSCSSSPSDEEITQLNNLKSEVSALETKIPEKKKEKANLEKLVAEKNGKLQQCQSDQEAVKKGLGE